MTKDIDPPGFDSLAGFVPPAGQRRREEPPKVTPAIKSRPVLTKVPEKSPPAPAHRQKELRQVKLAAAKASVQEAKKLLVAARVRAQSLGASQKKADAEAKQADKQKREAEQRFKAASTASAEAAVRAQRITAELERAQKSVDDAQRAVDRASKDLESLFRG